MTRLKWLILGGVFLVLFGLAIGAWLWFRSTPELIMPKAPAQVPAPIVSQFFDASLSVKERETMLLEMLEEMNNPLRAERWMARGDALARKVPQAALEWWLVTSANTFWPAADFAVGCAALEGYGMPYNRVLGEGMLSRAATFGYAPAYLRRELLRRAADLPQLFTPKSGEDFFYQGLYFAAGYYREVSIAQAKEAWTRAMELEHVEGTLFLAFQYCREGDIEQAKGLLEKIVKVSAPAKLWLARLLLENELDEMARKRAFDLLCSVCEDAECGADAALLLGWLTLKYEIEGAETPAVYFKASTKDGHPIGYFMNGACCFYGLGGAVKSTSLETIASLQLAANLRVVNALFMLAHIYAEGEGVERDDWTSFSYQQQVKKILDGLQPEEGQ
jgi:TPR repeat protein